MSKETKASPSSGAFLSDVTELRQRARKPIGEGAVTPGYRADRENVIQLLPKKSV